MKFNSKILLSVLLAAVICGAPSKSESKTIAGDYLKDNDIELEFSATTDFYSKYIWRGFRLDDDYVLQPGFSLSGYGFEVNVWGSFDTDQDDALGSDEVDTTLSYSHDFEGLSLFGLDLSTVSASAGHVYYDFPSAGTFSKEVFLGVAYDTLLAPSITWYHDYSRESQGGGHGDYVVLDLGHSLTLNEEYGITLDLSGHVGMNHRLFIAGDGGDVAFGAGITLPLTESLTLSPSLNYSVPFGDLEDSADGNQDDEFYWGVGVSCSF